MCPEVRAPSDTPAARIFAEHRDELERVAYRMLGSWAEAEDVAQDTWLRWSTVDHDRIDNHVGYLVRITTRLALDRAKRASRRHESYVGPWLPEPASAEPGPDDAALLAESLTLGFVTVLQRLGPVDRAVFLLHEVFGWSHADIAEVVERSEPTCRQIARRARERVRDDRRGARLDNDRDAELLGRAVLAAQAGEVAELATLLHDDVVLLSDGGPNRHAARNPIVGPERVARFLTGIARADERKGRATERTAEVGWINGQLGVLLVDDGEAFGAMVADTDGERIVALHSVIAPEKIGRLRR